MHTQDLSPWLHEHAYGSGDRAAEHRAWRVVALTAITMVVEILAGWWFSSMALLADGWHMSSHCLALGLTALAYWFARHHANDRRYAFGTWKVEVLGGFASAVLLAGVALLMAIESVMRLLAPTPIGFDQAIAVAVLGLAVNLMSAWLLKDGQHHNPHEHYGHHAQHHHRDLNHHAAFLHVLADATTSLLAILALLGGKYAGWYWLDPLMGVVGALIIAVWARGLLRDTGKVLLDREMDTPLVERLRAELEADGDSRVSDLHLWRVGRSQYACIVSLVTGRAHDPAHYKALLRHHGQLAHVTVEVNRCPQYHP
ncbi:MAG TPA: CDF family Co(II)/Ni(II) efflux transporter DmeF [Candidatus Competibacteraceae bacterium]|nr:CDF family Co(II)/Ni(II) efflux transporter DmeF [Candidatus Competibacteraceae bacterium]